MEASEESHETQVIQPDPDFAPDWPEDVRMLCARLFDQYDAAEIRNRDNLGASSFDDAPGRVAEVAQMVRDLSLERWGDLSLDIKGGLNGQLQELMNTLDAMVVLTSNDDGFVQQRENLNNRQAELYDWFRNNLPPAAILARVRRDQDGTANLGADTEKVEQLRSDTAGLDVAVEALKKELSSQQEAVKQARASAGQSASEELSAVYSDRANDCEHVAKRWLIALGIAVPAVAGIALLTFLALRPDKGAEDAHDFAGLGFGLFVLGLLAFIVRICAQNFRVNRHLAAVARSKLSSISTFQRLVASVADDELRSAVTLTLAQSIFAVEETGLVDGSGDHVTLVERVVATSVPAVK